MNVENADNQYSTGNPDEKTIIKEIAYPLYTNKIWIRVLAIPLMISAVLVGIGAIFTLLTFSSLGLLLGLIYGLITWLFVRIGLLLYKIANSTEQVYSDGSKQKLITILTDLGLYFKIMGILTLGSLVIKLAQVVVAHLGR